MIKDFKIMKLGFDFMGYDVKRRESLSFHHLIVPHRECKAQGLGEGYLYWNGAILVQRTSHDYAHIVQKYDDDRFMALTSEMIDEKIKGHLDPENIKRIYDILESFEKEYCGERNKKGNLIIKPEYIKQRKFKRNF